MKRQSRKSSSKISNKKTKITVNDKSNVFFEDKSGANSNFKIIFDKNEPFYKHTQEQQ